MARFVAIAILLAIGTGIFAFMQMSALSTAEMRLAKSVSDLADLKKRTGQNADIAKTATADLAACRDQVTGLQTDLDAASKKPAGKR